MKRFQNLSAFQEQFPEKAEELLEHYGRGKWMEHPLYYFDNLEDFAKYEVTRCWYYDIELELERDYRGAPDLLQFIDFERLGYALKMRWYDGLNYCFSDDSVIKTDYDFLEAKSRTL